jgi:hypothetical protein
VLRRGRRPPLFDLALTDQELQALAHHFAPLLTMADGAQENRFGRIVRGEDGFVVNGQQPVVYYYFSQTLVQDIPALQINYAIWFSERTAPAPWFEQGTLDGLLFRVTLNGQGQAIFVDVSFQCGCYHFILFDGELVSGKLPEANKLVPFVGGRLPALQEGERFHFGVNAGWHQIGRVDGVQPAPEQTSYQLLPYGELEYFREGDEVFSLFDHQGRVPGTNRLERFFLFPMGIPKVGAMRQRGRQPITLIGRGYFDDPYLFDHTFAYRTKRPDPADLLAPQVDGQPVVATTPAGDE